MYQIFKEVSIPQISLKAEETSLKHQIKSLNEQFQGLLNAVAERYPEILDEEFAMQAGKRRDTVQPRSKMESYRPMIPAAEARSRNYARSQQYFHGPLVYPKWFPGRVGHEGGEATYSQIPVQEQFQKASSFSGIDARKIRSSLPNSPTDESTVEPNQENSFEERRKRLKKRMVESRKVDVVSLGMF